MSVNAADLRGQPVDGLIHEEAMDKIWDISRIPLPLTDRIGKGTVGNARFSWTQDELQAPVIDGQVVDGSDTNAIDDTSLGDRVNNFTEIDVRVVKVSTRAQDSNTIGFSDTLEYQVMMRQRELRRSNEACMLSNNASQADDGNTVPGVTGGLDAWLVTNTSNGATGLNGGFNTTTAIVDAYTPGTPRPLNESIFKDLLQSVYEQGGEVSAMMARPAVVRKFSEYQFTDGARVATLQRETGSSDSPASSLGAVNVYISDWGTLQIVSNRLQQPIATDVSTMFILDYSLLSQVFLTGYMVQPLQKAGLSDTRQMISDWGLRVGTEKGLGAFRDIDETADMIAGP